MKKGKIIWKISSRILLFLIFFLLIILLTSANWFLNNFEVDFSIAIYQLFSPLKGTESGVLSDYIDQCLYPSLFLRLYW